jgi:general secretion pathway protein G
MRRVLRHSNRGFTLIEIVLVIVIVGLLATVATQTATQMYDTARMEETKDEMDMLAGAIVGNPRLVNNGSRSDFGYVGDIGALPPDLDALVSNPGGFATWRGPYLAAAGATGLDDYLTDAWGSAYVYGGITITSSGSGSTVVKRLAGSTDDLLLNRVSGSVLDLNGTPPGPVWADSIQVLLAVPDGSGGIMQRLRWPDPGGYFAFDSVPIGIHALRVVYQPTADTLIRYLSVDLGSEHSGVYKLPEDVW